MIIVKLMGGLGNQMFQYAAGRALAVRHHTSLKLDLSFLLGAQEGATHRPFILDRLRIVAGIALSSEIPPPEPHHERFLLRVITQLASKFTCQHNQNVLYEFDNRINTDFFIAPDNTCLIGYWQSERYFRNISDLIKEELTPPELSDIRSIELAARIRGMNAISIHVRRGDYVTDPQINVVHGVCSEAYYRQAIEMISRQVYKPHFFIFSDEPDWARKHLTTSPYPMTVVDHNSEKPHEDLFLMSICKHNIIANSSFSWWGAWLNRYSEKMVIAPQKWFASNEHVPEGLLPEGWVQL